VLIDMRSVPEGDLLWSHSYVIERDAPFVLVQEVARSIASALDFSAYPGRTRGSTRNLAAFEAYVEATEADSRDATRKLLLHAVELDPTFAEAWDWLAAMEVMPVWNGQTTVDEAWARAKPYLDRAFELDPELPAAYVTLGRFKREAGDIDGAIASFRRALELDPGNGWAGANLGLALRFSGRYEEALAVHDMGVTMDPLSSAAQTRLGTSYWFVENFESAERHYRIAMDLDPTYAEVYDSWSGMLSAGQGRFDEALAMMRRKLSLPGEPTARSLARAGALCSILGMDQAALDYWQSAKEVNPAYRSVDEERLQHFLARGDDGTAREIASAILGRDPTNDEAILALAILAVEPGDWTAFSRRARDAYPAYFEGPVLARADEAGRGLLVALAYGAEGDEEQKRLELQAVQQAIAKPRAWQHLALAAAYAMSGDRNEALRYLRSSPPGRVRSWAPVIMRDPRFATLRDDDEFSVLVGEHLEEIRLQGSRVTADPTLY
jgi:Tfp pilus assembly protein PilF